MRNKGKKIIKNNKKVEAVFKESHAIVLLEDMRDDIKLIAEGVSGLREEMNRRFEQVDKKFERIDENFKAVFEFQSNFSDEVYERLDQLDSKLAEIKEELKKINKNKVDVKKFNLLEKRVIKLERKLEKYKIIASKKQQARQAKKQQVG